uniref:Putative secreted protein n=1 Tax=Anopheles darlingi TaxID=43151 RepID=A0A2M4DDW4_ANODA
MVPLVVQLVLVMVAVQQLTFSAFVTADFDRPALCARVPCRLPDRHPSLHPVLRRSLPPLWYGPTHAAFHHSV